MSGLTALVLAGSRGPGDPVAAAAGVPHKAFADVGGAPMIVRVVRALRAAPSLGVIAICTDRADLMQADAELAPLIAKGAVRLLPAASSPSASVAAALETLGAPLLVTTADHALLRAEWVEAFLADLDAHADVTAAVARSDVVLAAAPGVRRTFLRFSDATVSGCNLFHLATPAAAGVAALWRRLEAERKRPWRMAALLGSSLLLGYLAGRLSLDGALARIGQLSSARLGVVFMTDGRAAIDVDKAADLDLVRRLVAEDAASIGSPPS